jgi:pimeloyl-ACP methyl ester carboxylesterase
VVLLAGTLSSPIGVGIDYPWDKLYMTRYQNPGFDVIAYDNRAHGNSGGEACTYWFCEKEDLQLSFHFKMPRLCHPASIKHVPAKA